MADLFEDIKTGSEKIVTYFKIDKITLDYSVRSFIEIDRFYYKNCKDGKPIKDGDFSKDLGVKLFSIGAYIGETIIKVVPGSRWEADEKEPNNEVMARVKFPDGTTIWPVQRAISRFRNSDDSVYVYGYHLTKEFSEEPFEQSFWNINAENSQRKVKPWWKFW